MYEIVYIWIHIHSRLFTFITTNAVQFFSGFFETPAEFGLSSQKAVFTFIPNGCYPLLDGVDKILN